MSMSKDLEDGFDAQVERTELKKVVEYLKADIVREKVIGRLNWWEGFVLGLLIAFLTSGLISIFLLK